MKNLIFLTAFLLAGTANISSLAAVSVNQSENSSSYEKKLSIRADLKSYKPQDFKYDNGLIFVDVLINGKQATALIDTGFSATMIDAKFAKTHGIDKLISNSQYNFSNIKGNFNRIEKISIGIPNQIAVDIPPVVSDLSKINNFSKEKFDIIIGNEILSNLDILLTFTNSKIGLSPPGLFQLKNSFEIPMTKEFGITSKVNGKYFSVNVDSGSSHQILLYSDDANSSFIGRHPTGISKIAAVDGAVYEAKRFNNQNFQIANDSYGIDVSLSSYKVRKNDGAIGISGLKYNYILLQPSLGRIVLSERR